jgi:hypothetical protein
MTAARTVKIESIVDQRWIDFVFSEEVFSWNVCGYWARGVAWGQADEVGWLLWEAVEKRRLGHEDGRADALRAWDEGRELPRHWYRLDLHAAARAWGIGVKRWGERWYEEGDNTRYDVVLQLALLGEVRYG